VPEAKDEFCILTMVGIEGVVFGCMIEVVEVVGVVLVMRQLEQRL
jgi:hypothetical protein